jgi:aerobic carbon-monoxide dehydrogenase small subunit
MKAISLTLNGRSLAAAVEPRTHLADFLRETQGLTGTHLGCEHGICGACTLLVDGVPVRSCITYAIACNGAAVTTIEGLDDDEIAKELREAFAREHALQCGYCTPGILVSARDLVVRAKRADEHEIRMAMSGNLCRCTGYVGIVRAIYGVIDSRRARGIAAIPDAGRMTIGPAGSGHAKTSFASHGERSEALAASTPPPRSSPQPVEAPTVPICDFEPQVMFSHNFVVHHPREDVWAFFARIHDVAACLPGASITGGDDRCVTGKMRIKVGPIAADFEGIAVVDRDAATYSGTIRGSGRDTRSSSATRGSISYRVVSGEDPRSTRVDVTVGYTLTGMLAQFSRTDLMQDIVNRITKGFVHNLEARLAAPGQAAPRPAGDLNAGALVLSVVAERIKGWFRKLIGR